MTLQHMYERCERSNLLLFLIQGTALLMYAVKFYSNKMGKETTEMNHIENYF